MPVAVCECCGFKFNDNEPAPHICSTCMQIGDELQWQEWLAAAKAAGYDSVDAHIEAMRNEP